MILSRVRILPGRIAAVLALVAILLSAGCRSPEKAREGTPSRSRTDTVKVGFLPVLSYAPFMIAKDAGFFSAAGITVDLVPMRHNEGYTALGNGFVDVYAGPLNPGFFNMIARGQRIRIVGDKGVIGSGDRCSPYSLLVRNAALPPGSTPTKSQLRKFTFAFSPYSQWDYVVAKYLARYGLTLDDIHHTVIPSELLTEAFKQGKVDVAIGAEPVQTQILDSGLARELAPFSRMIPSAQMSVIFYGRRLLDEDPELGVRFMSAYLKGAREFAKGPTDSNVRIIAKYTGVSPSLIRRTCWVSLRLDGSIDFASTDDFVRWCASKGYVDRVVGRSEYWDGRFVGESGTGSTK